MFFISLVIKAVFSALSSAACSTVNISAWQVSDGGQCTELQAAEEQWKKTTAYYSLKGILSRDLDKASHIIVPPVSDCNPERVSVWRGMTWKWERSRLCLFCFPAVTQFTWLSPSVRLPVALPTPGRTADTIQLAADLICHDRVMWMQATVNSLKVSLLDEVDTY